MQVSVSCFACGGIPPAGFETQFPETFGGVA
jgi:hypothetical protein